MSEDTSAVTWRCGRFTIEPAARRLLRDGQPVELEAKVFDLIMLLIEQRARALDKRELTEALWGQRPVTDAALSQLLHKARRALDDDGEHQAVIRTVYGHGLQWVAPLKVIEPARAGPAANSAAASTPAFTQPVIGRTRTRWPRLALLIGLLVVLAIAIWAIPRAMAPPVSVATRVAVLPLVNATGNDALGWTRRGLPALIASLLAHHGDVDVLDTAKVGRAWRFSVPKDESRVQHLRQSTGADIVITPRLVKLMEPIYQLSAHVERGGWHRAFKVSVQGEKPAQLAVQLVARIRGGLALDPIRQPPFAVGSNNAYLAETFARGMDAAVRGDWQQAKPYFELMARDDPDFLPARLRLARAQMYTDQRDAARKALHAVICDARRSGQTEPTALAWLQLGLLAMSQRQAAPALEALTKARHAAAAGASPKTRAMIELTAADAARALHRGKEAGASLTRAQALIEVHDLRSVRSRMYDALAFQAQTRGDPQAAIAAERAALVIDTARGDDGNVMNADFNLAILLVDQGRTLDALPLYASAWQLARQHGARNREFTAALNLAINLINLGAVDRAAPFIADVKRLAHHGGPALGAAVSPLLRALVSWYRGEPDAAFAEASTAIEALGKDPPNDTIVVTLLVVQAGTALLARPDALPAIAARMDGIAAKHAKSGAFVYQQALIHALAAAARNDDAGVAAALAAARAAPHTEDAHGNTARAFALAIALHNDNAAAAREALRDYDLAHSHDADILRLTALWARKNGNQALAQQADARRQAVLTQAHDALARIEPAVMPAPAASVTPAMAR